MADKDINIKVEARGAEETKRRVDQVADSTRKVGTGAEATEKKTGLLTSALASLATKAMAAFGAYKLLTQAIGDNRRAMEEAFDIIEKREKALVRLQFLGGYFRERPELRKEVSELAEFGRRPFEEVAGAWYNLRSKGGAISPDMQQAILREALELGRTDPAMPLDTLVDMFTLYAKKTREQDANIVQNVLKQTITEAGGGGEDVARYMPEFLPVGMAGGLTGPQASGLWAYATTLLASPSAATTNLRNVFMALQGKGTPEGQKLLAGMGVTPGMGFMDQMQALSAAQAGGRLDLTAAEQIAGRESASLLLELVRDPDAMRRVMETVTGVARPDVDLTRKELQDLLGTDEVARMMDDIQRGRIGVETAKARNLRSLRWKEHLTAFEEAARKEDLSEVLIQDYLRVMQLMQGVGAEPGDFYEWEERMDPVYWGNRARRGIVRGMPRLVERFGNLNREMYNITNYNQFPRTDPVEAQRNDPNDMSY